MTTVIIMLCNLVGAGLAPLPAAAAPGPVPNPAALGALPSWFTNVDHPAASTQYILSTIQSPVSSLPTPNSQLPASNSPVLPAWFSSPTEPAGQPVDTSSHHTILPNTVTIDGPTEINNCDIVTFTIVAVNDPVTTTSVIITSTMPTGFIPTQRVFDVGTVLPNEVITRHAVFSATCDAVSGQNVTTLSQDDYADITRYTDFLVNPGAITLRKEPAVIPATVGDVVTWTVYVENTGYGTVSNVVVTDTLGAGLEYVSGLTATSYISIPVGETVAFPLSARVVACSGLDNDVEARWGCWGQTCQTHDAQASVDLIVYEPLLEYTPPPISLDYCSGQGSFAMTVSNVGEGTAYTPTIAVDFSPLSVIASSALYGGGAFHLSDIPSGDAYVLTFTLSLSDPVCGMADADGNLLYEPLYYNQCGNPFFPPVRSGSWSMGGDTPALNVSKSGPNEIYVGDIITYTLGVVSDNVSGTVHITDTFQSDCTGYTPLDVAGGTVISDAAGIVTITWMTTDTNWTADISFQPSATTCPTSCTCCGQLATNVLEASASDCQDCIVSDTDDQITALQCQDILNSGKQVSPSSAEACTARVYAATYAFGSSFAVTPTWQGMVFTDTLVNQTYVAGSARVSVTDGIHACTATLTVDDTDPLVIDNISPTCAITVPGATMQVSFQAIVDDAYPCSGGSFYDWSYLNIGVTGNGICPGDPQCDDGLFEEGVWVEVVEPMMRVTISDVPAQVAPCGVYTPLVTLTRVGSVPAYDAYLNFPITDYAIVRGLDFSGATPVVTHTGTTSYTWEYGDAFATATTGTVRLRVQRRCDASGPVQATAGYGNLCADSGMSSSPCAATDIQSSQVLTPNTILYKFPEIIYASGDVVTWTLTAINSGAGPAYGVTLTDTLGSGLRYLRSDVTSTLGSAAGVTPITSSNLVTWTDLTMLSSEEYVVRYAAEIVGCEDLTNSFAGVQECQGQVCAGHPPQSSYVVLPETVLINTNNALTPLAICFTRTVTATVRNAGLMSVYSATIAETLPPGMVYVAGSTEYVVGTEATPPPVGWISGGEPAGAPAGPLVWTASQIPNLARLYPHETVWVRFDVYADCDFPGGNITIRATYQDVCGNPHSSAASNFMMPSNPPEMSAQKQGRNLTTGSGWVNRIYAEPGDQVQWAITVTNGGDALGQLIVVTDTLPSNVSFDSATPPPDGMTGNVITWTVGTLGQANWLALITTTVAGGGCTAADTSNEVIVTWGCPTGCRQQATAQAALRTRPVFGQPDTVTGISPATLHRCGGLVTATLTNNGPPAYGVVLTDALPTGFVYSDTVYASTSPVTYPTASDNPAVWVWGTVTLPTGVTTVVFRVNSGAGGTCSEPPDGDNVVTLLYDDVDSCVSTGPYLATGSTGVAVVSPTLQIEKTPTVQSAGVGETVTWTVRITNTGTGDAPDVVVTDTVGSGFSDSRVITWSVGTLAADGGAWTAIVTATVADSGGHVNTVEARGACAAGCTYASASDVARVTLLQDFGKAPDVQTGTIGSMVVFTFTASLPDADALYEHLSLTDTLPPGLGYVSSVLTYTYNGPGAGATTHVSNTPTIAPVWLGSGPVVWQLGDLSGTVQLDGAITAVIQNTPTNQSGIRLANRVSMTYVDDGQPYASEDTADVDVLEPILHLGKSYVTPHACDAALAQDNFNDGDAAGWTGSGGWSVAGGIYTTFDDASARYYGNVAWTDYSFSAMMRAADDDAEMGIYFRYQDSDNYYRLRWRNNNNGTPSPRLRFERRVGGATTNQDQNIRYEPGRWYHVEIRGRGSLIDVYIDGQLVFTDDDATLTGGQVGLYAGNGGGARAFDDVLLTRMDDVACIVGANDLVTYTLVISNQGYLTGYDLVITDALPAGMSLVTYTLASDDPASLVEVEPIPIPGATGVLTWGVSQLAATAPFDPAIHTALTLTVVLQVSDAITANAILANQALLSYDNWEEDGDPLGDSYGVDVERRRSGGSHSAAVRTVDGGIAKSVTFSPPPTATLGTLVTYTLVVPADPITATLYDARVLDALDARLQLLAVTDGPDGAVQVAGNTYTATYASIPAGQQRTITVAAVLSDSLGAGAGDLITNVAVLTHSNGGPTHSDVVTTPVHEPDLALIKDADPPDGSVVVEGEWITYTVAVTNAAGSDASPAYDLVIRDVLPLWMRTTPPAVLGLTINGAAAPIDSQSYDSLSGQFVITVTPSISLPVGGSLVLTYLAQVDIGVSSGLALTNDARASYSSLPGDVPGDRDYVTNDDDETHYTPLATGLRKFVAPPTVTIGSQVVYTYRLPYPLVGATLHNVVFTDVIPSNFIVTGVSGDGGFVSNWSGGNLVTGTVTSILANRLVVITVTCTVRDVVANVSGLVVTNTAVMDYSGSPSDPPASNPVTTTLAEPRVVLGKAVQLSRDPLGAGDAVTYTLTLTNTGNWPAFDLVITDALPVGITFFGTDLFAVSDPVTATLTDANVAGASDLAWAVSRLNVGGVVTIRYTAHVSDDIGAGLTLTNTADGSYTNLPGENPGERRYDVPDDAESVNTGDPDLTLVKADGRHPSAVPSPVGPGSLLTYTLAVTNTGIVNASSVVLTDAVPADTTFVAGTTPRVGPDGRRVMTWTLGTLAPDVSATVTFTVRVDGGVVSGAFLTNTAWLTSAEGLTDTDAITTPVGWANVAITKSVTPPAVASGQRVTFTLAYANVSPVAAENVLITDVLPLGLSYLSAVPMPAGVSGSVITWSLGTLAVGAGGTIQLVATVDHTSTTQAVLTNTVVISTTTPETDGTDNADDATTVLTQTGDVRIAKTAQPPAVVSTDRVTYTLTYANAGPADATDVIVTDTLPVGLTFAGCDPATCGVAGRVIAWSLGIVPASASGVLTVYASVDVTGALSAIFTNTAVIATTTDDRDSDNNDDDATTPLSQTVGLRVIKSVLPDLAVDGQTLTYGVRLVNVGDTPLNPVRLEDHLPPGFLYDDRARVYPPAGGAPLEPDLVAEPTLLWNDVTSGAGLPAGESMSLTFRVTVATGITGTFINVVTATGTTPTGPITGTDDAPVSIADPAVLVHKQLVAYDSDEVRPNYVTFTVAITDVGPSVIDVLPLHDHYDPYYLAFVDAVPYPDAQDGDAGVLTWYDLTAPPPGGISGFGRDLPPGDAFFVTTVFTVAHTIDVTTTNVATVTGATDDYDNPVAVDRAVAVITDTIPTAAELRYFRIGTVAGHEVRLEWATAMEVNNFGFKLYRASVVERSRASAVAFVPPHAWGGGATYVYTDTVPNDGLWWYWLADVDMSGLETFHGPVWAGVDVNTSFQRVYLPLVMR